MRVSPILLQSYNKPSIKSKSKSASDEQNKELSPSFKGLAIRREAGDVREIISYLESIHTFLRPMLCKPYELKMSKKGLLPMEDLIKGNAEDTLHRQYLEKCFDVLDFSPEEAKKGFDLNTNSIDWLLDDQDGKARHIQPGINNHLPGVNLRDPNQRAVLNNFGLSFKLTEKQPIFSEVTAKPRKVYFDGHILKFLDETADKKPNKVYWVYMGGDGQPRFADEALVLSAANDVENDIIRLLSAKYKNDLIYRHYPYVAGRGTLDCSP